MQISADALIFRFFACCYLKLVFSHRLTDLLTSPRVPFPPSLFAHLSSSLTPCERSPALVFEFSMAGLFV